MIKRFRSKALKLAFGGDISKLLPQVAQRIVEVLDALDAATSLDDLKELTGFHELQGDRQGEYAVTITRNWRIVFSPAPESEMNPNTNQEEEIFHVSRVSYEDYH